MPYALREQDKYAATARSDRGQGRGTGEWRKGQHSWNISVTNEVRGGTKVTVGIVSGIAISGNLFLLMKKITSAVLSSTLKSPLKKYIKFNTFQIIVYPGSRLCPER